MASSGGNSESGEPEFQIAPMIDVLLVLLIFFMSITTTQVARVMQEIELPVADSAAKRDDARDESVINVQWNAAARTVSFICDERRAERASEFAPLLARRRELSGDRYRLVVRGDRETPARYIQEAMNTAAQAGIAHITFSAYPR